MQLIRAEIGAKCEPGRFQMQAVTARWCGWALTLDDAEQGIGKWIEVNW